MDSSASAPTVTWTPTTAPTRATERRRDTLLVRRARFGFQGNYGSHFDFALLTDANSTTGAIVRDVYLNVRIRPEFQFQAGQFKEPFAQETGIGATNLDFVERGLQSLLYPCAVTAYRCPGLTLHGDIDGGVMQWWAGAFNGRGGVAANVTNEPEFVGRVRFYPWRKTKNEWLRQLAFGGSISPYALPGPVRRRELQCNSARRRLYVLPAIDINGPIERYEGEFTYIKGPLRCAVNTCNCKNSATASVPRHRAVWVSDSSRNRREGLEYRHDLPAHGRKAA